MFEPHANRVRVSSSPRSSVVTGGSSRPQLRGDGPSSEARMRPAKMSSEGLAAAAASSAASQPGRTLTSSSRNATSCAVPALTPLLRAAFSPSGAPSGS